MYILGRLLKNLCNAAGLKLAASHEPLAHHWNVAILSLEDVHLNRLVNFTMMKTRLVSLIVQITLILYVKMDG